MSHKKNHMGALSSSTEKERQTHRKSLTMFAENFLVFRKIIEVDKLDDDV